MWADRARTILKELEPLAADLNLKIVEMDLPQSANGIFRIYVDSLEKDEPISIDRCAELSPVVSDYLDTCDFFPFRYYLEISSPGLNRPIRRWDEISDFLGKKVKVTLREKVDNRRKFTGELVSVDNDALLFIVKDAEGEHKIEKEMVRKINIVWEGEN